MATRAADRKRMIDDLERAGDPLAREFADASARAQAAAHMARASGEYPLLSGGDVNLYSLFVERAMTLVKPDGLVGLLTPSGIASGQDGVDILQGRGDGRSAAGTFTTSRIKRCSFLTCMRHSNSVS